MLFMLTYLLSAVPPKKTEPGLDKLTTPGILQITWLLGNDDHFIGIQKPELQALRKAGMFDVELCEMVQEKTAQPLDDCEFGTSETTALKSVSIADDASNSV